jgi:hypothetical protein
MPLIHEKQLERIEKKTDSLVDSGTRMAAMSKQAAQVLIDAEREEIERRLAERERQRKQSPIARFFHAIFG